MATVGPSALESFHQEVRLAVVVIGSTRFAHVMQRECPRMATSVEALVLSSPVRADFVGKRFDVVSVRQPRA